VSSCLLTAFLLGDSDLAVLGLNVKRAVSVKGWTVGVSVSGWTVRVRG
jgi:hypothetical protein